MADQPTITLPFDQYLERLGYAHEKGYVNGLTTAVSIVVPQGGSGTSDVQNVRNAILKVIAAGLETFLAIREKPQSRAIGEMVHRMIQEGENAVRTG